MRRAHVSVDVGARLPAFVGDETAGLADAFMHVVGEAAVLAPRGRDAVLGGRNETLPRLGANLGTGNHEEGI